MTTITNLDSITNELTLVDFFATWCGPCRMLGPIVEEASKTHNVFKVNIDEASELTKEFNINVVPTLVLLKNKKEISRKEGYMPLDDLLNWMDENK